MFQIQKDSFRQSIKFSPINSTETNWMVFALGSVYFGVIIFYFLIKYLP